MNLKMNDEIMEHHTPFFDKSTTLVIKGIALIMMFIHHFFTFPSVWTDGISYPLLEKLAPFLCSPTKLCVSIFCFLSGYCFYFSKEKSIRHSLIKITDLFIAYWLVFVIFALLAKFCVGYVYSIEGILLEAFALSLPTMRYCWYVYFYVLFMLALPLITKIMRGVVHLDLIIIAVVIFICGMLLNFTVPNTIPYRLVESMYLWFPVVLMGYVFAEFQLFERAKEYISNRTRTTILCTTLVFLALIGRFLEPSIRFRFERIPELKMNLDVLYAPMFIFAIVTLFEKRPFKHMRGVLSVIGKYSMMMWFLSCIFFNNSKTVFQPILYAVKNPILVLIWGCILCLIPAFFLTKLVRIFTDLKNSVLFHRGE